MSFREAATRSGSPISTGRATSGRLRRVPETRRLRYKRLEASSLPRPDHREGPSTDLVVIWSRLKKLALPYWTDPEVGTGARWRLVGVVVLTVATTGVSVGFNFLGRDFFNALSEKDVDLFTMQLLKYLGAFAVGIPVFVFRDYLQLFACRLLCFIAAVVFSVYFNFAGRDFYNALADRDSDQLKIQLFRFFVGTLCGTPVFVFSRYGKNLLSTEWRQWMANKFLSDYLKNRTFYKVQSTAAFDNPDQRISVDVQAFTGTALGFVLAILNAGIDLISFSEILFSIYPPLFVALITYAVGGTWLSIRIGRSLVGLNFRQEAKEADFRFGLVRLRENAESIAFYSGEMKEQNILLERLQTAILNYKDLLIASRNLDFFTSFYRYLIMLLPAAVVAPLFFRGDIGFGVVTQSQSAFSHILSDVSLVVYQFEALAGFSAVIDRLGEFAETVTELETNEIATEEEQIELHTKNPPDAPKEPLLSINNLTLQTPDSRSVLIQELSFKLLQGQSLLITGPSGAGKTSLLRAIAGLWTSGSGSITRYGTPIGADNKNGTIMFVPQKPYLVLGTLREQLLYPTWTNSTSIIEDNGMQWEAFSVLRDGVTVIEGKDKERPAPADWELEKTMLAVNLGEVLQRCREEAETRNALDTVTDWASQLSVGEQQRLAFARILLSSPQLLLMDESTSALDITNEQALYKLLVEAGISFVSVGHRPTLRPFHSHTLHLTPALSEESGSLWSFDLTNSSRAEV